MALRLLSNAKFLKKKIATGCWGNRRWSLGKKFQTQNLKKNYVVLLRRCCWKLSSSKKRKFPEEDEIPATQPDSPLFTPLKDAAAAKDPPPSAEAVEKELKVAEASLAVNAMDAVDVRKKQLTMRAAEREKKDAGKCWESCCQKASQKAESKSQGKASQVGCYTAGWWCWACWASFQKAEAERRVRLRQPHLHLPKRIHQQRKAKQLWRNLRRTRAKQLWRRNKRLVAKPMQMARTRRRTRRKLLPSLLPKRKPAWNVQLQAGSADGHAAGKKAKMSDGAAGSSKKRGNKSTGEGTEPDKELQKEMMSVIEKFVNKEYDKKGESMHHGKYGDDVQVVNLLVPWHSWNQAAPCCWLGQALLLRLQGSFHCLEHLRWHRGSVLRSKNMVSNGTAQQRLCSLTRWSGQLLWRPLQLSRMQQLSAWIFRLTFFNLFRWKAGSLVAAEGCKSIGCCKSGFVAYPCGAWSYVSSFQFDFDCYCCNHPCIAAAWSSWANYIFFSMNILKIFDRII